MAQTSSTRDTNINFNFFHEFKSLNVSVNHPRGSCCWLEKLVVTVLEY